jgi:multicomponent Na+:H+ antiporter subunit A
LAIPADITILTTIFAPFAAAAIAPFLVRRLGRFAAPLLALVPLGIFAAEAALIGSVAAGGATYARFPWAPSFGIDLTFTLDGLSLLFILTISGIGALIVLYSGAYLHGHPHLGRFLAFILAFMGAMLGLVLADDLVLLYAFWELTSVTSFLLIGFDHTRFVARRAAVQALVVTSFGGLALLLGAVVLNHATGFWDLSTMAGQGASLRTSAVYPLIFGLFALAAFTKSAQLPFQFWLPNAMEAPTPVSAFLHSAAMVQAGVYLLMRVSPLLAGTTAWSTTLILFGSATLLWGGVVALRHSDLKLMLAQSTVASLGLLVLLIGIGGEAAILAAAAYFVTHALYKAGLFLTVGLIDHETGVRDITALGGLRDKMALTFIAAMLAGLSMLGFPPAFGYLAKEATYLALPNAGWLTALVAAVLVLGNASLGALALAIAGRPFLGVLAPTPKDPHEGPVAMLAGPVLLGMIGIAAAILTSWVASMLLAPAVAAVSGSKAEVHFGFSLDLLNPAFGLSLATWTLSALIFWRLDWLRTMLRRLDADAWSFDRASDGLMAGIVALANAFTRVWQNGRLSLYLLTLFLVAGLSVLVALIGSGGAPALPTFPMLTAPEWGVAGLALFGLGAVLLMRDRLLAILALGVPGMATALLYLLFGAPDLGFTQFMVETLSLVVLALVLARLRLDRHGRRAIAVALRDGVVAVLVGGAVTLLLLKILEQPLDDRLPAFFIANSEALAHGRNVVNVILVDFRGLDTLGEISVVLTAGVAILALVAAGRHRGDGILDADQRHKPMQPKKLEPGG